MKKFNKLAVVWVILWASCGHDASRPAVISPDAFHDAGKCDIPFITGSRRFIHAIEGVLPEKRTISAIGITVMNSERRTIQCVMMTLEGFVLFDALYDSELTINRAVPPFDSKVFAQGMMDDIRLIFFKPDGILSQSGLSESGEFVCRFVKNNRIITDVAIGPNRYWEIREYNEHSQMMRKVNVCPGPDAPVPEPPSIPNKLELTAYGEKPYTLKLNLIQSESL